MTDTGYNEKLEEDLQKALNGKDPQVAIVDEGQIIHSIDVAKGKDELVFTTIVHCTTIKKKKNKPLAGKEFMFKGTLNEAQVEERIASYYISQGVIGGLKKEVKQYFKEVFDGKIEHDKEDMHFLFDMFYNNFRFIIGK